MVELTDLADLDHATVSAGRTLLIGHQGRDLRGRLRVEEAVDENGGGA